MKPHEIIEAKLLALTRRPKPLEGLATPLAPSTAPAADIGALIVEWVEAEWQKVVREPAEPGEVEAITRYILDGAAWPTADVLTWHVGAPYRDGGVGAPDSFAWCGAFAAAAVHGAGAGVDDEGRRQMVSPERLFASHRARKIKLSEIKGGDVVTMGDRKTRRHGSHIAVVVAVRLDGLVETIEGNAVGLLGDGSIGEGVIRRTRPLPSGAGGGPRETEACSISGRPQNARLIDAYRFA